MACRQEQRGAGGWVANDASRRRAQAPDADVLIAATELTPTNASLLRALRVLAIGARVVLPGELGLLRPASASRIALGRLDLDAAAAGVTADLWRLKRLERGGAAVVNTAAALLACHDKLALALALGGAGLPHPRTAFVDGAGDLPTLAPPYIVRRRFGNRDDRLAVLPDTAALSRYLRRLGREAWFRQQGALVQEVAAYGPGDLRLVVAGGEVVGGVGRLASSAAWQRLREAPAEARVLAAAAAAAVGAGLVGVELIRRDDGYRIVDLDGAVEFTSDDSVDGADVFEQVALWLRRELLELAVRARVAPRDGATAVAASRGSDRGSR